MNYFQKRRAEILGSRKRKRREVVERQMRWTRASGAFSFLHGRRRRRLGETNPAAKLTAGQVREIRELRESGVVARVLANRYGVGLTAIYNIANGLRWRHA